MLQPLTDKSRRKLQSTENFIGAIKTVQIPEDYKLVSFDVKRGQVSKETVVLRRWEYCKIIWFYQLG